MRKSKWSLIAMALVIACFAASLAAPLLRGESLIDLGLDLAGGVIVTYRPDFGSRLDIYADAGEEELLALTRETLASRLYRSLDTVPDVVVRGDRQTPGDRRIVVSLPGSHDYRRVLDLVGRTYHLTLRLVAGERPAEAQGLHPYRGRYLELAPPVFSGDMLDERYISVAGGDAGDFALAPKVTFRFKPPHDRKFAEFTGDNIDRELAILLDDRVEWAGTIESAIDGTGLLSGNYRLDEATDIARMLRSGTLPISLEVESLSAIGPGLGQELRDLGWRALLLSLVVLMALVAGAYLHRRRLLIAGALSLLFLLLAIGGLVAGFGLTLDLVGIAGLVLSVGMGMDAFIIVFEALEARRQGFTPGQLATHGGSLLRRVYSFAGEGRTLFHANATTLVVVLLLLMTERLRSFALFIAVGICASVLTIFFTREILGRIRESGGGPDLVGGLRRWRPGVFRLRKLYFAAVAAGVLVTALALVRNSPAGPSLELGADFRPGTQLVVAAAPGGDLEVALDELREELPGVELRFQGLGSADGRRYLLTLGATVAAAETGRPASPGTVTAERLDEIFAANSVDLESVSSIDGRVSSRRLGQSLSVLLWSFLLLALYFAVLQGPIDRWFAPARDPRRQESRSLGGRLAVFAGILLAVVVDLAVILAFLAVAGIPIGLPVIAAMLTILGYSVNDSVVLWSHVENRWAELRGRGERRPAAEVVSSSVDRILSRALLTSLSTMVPALSILVVGLEPLFDFAWVMIVGTAAGTLSSMFVVGTFAVRALEREPCAGPALTVYPEHQAAQGKAGW